jgi:hypothetical protein
MAGFELKVGSVAVTLDTFLFDLALTTPKIFANNQTAVL